MFVACKGKGGISHPVATTFFFFFSVALPLMYWVLSGRPVVLLWEMNLFFPAGRFCRYSVGRGVVDLIFTRSVFFWTFSSWEYFRHVFEFRAETCVFIYYNYDKNDSDMRTSALSAPPRRRETVFGFIRVFGSCVKYGAFLLNEEKSNTNFHF